MVEKTQAGWRDQGRLCKGELPQAARCSEPNRKVGSKSMATLATKFRKLLLTQFKGAELEIDSYPESDRAGATIVWKGFEGKNEIERQRLVRTAIEKGLGPQQAKRISIVLTFTPAEMSAMREGSRI